MILHSCHHDQRIISPIRQLTPLSSIIEGNVYIQLHKVYEADTNPQILQYCSSKKKEQEKTQNHTIHNLHIQPSKYPQLYLPYTQNKPNKMRFSLLSLTTTLLAATTAHGAVTLSPRTSPNQVTTVLDQLTSGVGDLNAIAENINGLTAIILAPAVAQGLVNLNNAVSVASLGLNLAGGALPTPSVADQTAICTALGTVSFFFSPCSSPVVLCCNPPPPGPSFPNEKTQVERQFANHWHMLPKICLSFWTRSQP